MIRLIRFESNLLPNKLFSLAATRCKSTTDREDHGQPKDSSESNKGELPIFFSVQVPSVGQILRLYFINFRISSLEFDSASAGTAQKIKITPQSDKAPVSEPKHIRSGTNNRFVYSISIVQFAVTKKWVSPRTGVMCGRVQDHFIHPRYRCRCIRAIERSKNKSRHPINSLTPNWWKSRISCIWHRRWLSDNARHWKNFAHRGRPAWKRTRNAISISPSNTSRPIIVKHCPPYEIHWPGLLRFALVIVSWFFPFLGSQFTLWLSFQLKLSVLPLDKHARDKFLRLVEDRYDPETDMLTLVVDRCPLRKQNFDYARYLLTALFYESFNVEPWEALKSEADMEYYDWNRNRSKEVLDAILAYGDQSGDQPKPSTDAFAASVEQLFNDGENEQNLQKYKNEALKLLIWRTNKLAS